MPEKKPKVEHTQYVIHIARAIIRKYKVKADLKSTTPRDFAKQFGHFVDTELLARGFGPDSKGRIASYGLAFGTRDELSIPPRTTSLSQVEPKINRLKPVEDVSGYHRLDRLAVYTLLAAMFDILDHDAKHPPAGGQQQ